MECMWVPGRCVRGGGVWSVSVCVRWGGGGGGDGSRGGWGWDGGCTYLRGDNSLTTTRCYRKYQ